MINIKTQVIFGENYNKIWDEIIKSNSEGYRLNKLEKIGDFWSCLLVKNMSKEEK